MHVNREVGTDSMGTDLRPSCSWFLCNADLAVRVAAAGVSFPCVSLSPQ